MKRWWIIALEIVVFAGAWGMPVRAETSLQVNPLKYDDTVGGQVKSGYIDVANPGDAPVTITTEVDGFRQADLDGNLQFFHDDTLTIAIKPDLSQFVLGPHESLRMPFTVDPAKLPAGGIYAVIFFRTVPVMPSSNVSYVAEAANVGTLLLLNHGTAAQPTGQIAHLDLPFWQFGAGLVGSLNYHNPAGAGGVAFTPALTTRVWWLGPASLAGQLVLPGATRRLAVTRPGSYLGLLPVTVHDAATGRTATAWVFACTGWYPLVLLPVVLTLLWWVSRAPVWQRLLRRSRRQR